MTGLVVDASVAAKWVLPEVNEPFADRAARLLHSFANGSIHLFVPDLFWLELGNLLWKAVRRGRIDGELAQRGLEGMVQRGFTTFPTFPHMSEALEIAMDFDQSVYDSAYVAMAVATGSDLITADERLVRALGLRFPVRWLGAY